MYDFDIINNSTPIFFARKKNDCIATISGLPLIYHKEFDLNEFIGEELARIRGVNSVHYFPLLFENREKVFGINNYFDKCLAIRVGSFDFKEAGVQYLNACDLISKGEYSTLEFLLSLCPNVENREEFLDELLELYALDIYCAQTDRPSNIYYEIRQDGSIHVGKLFDYEQSFDSSLGEYYASDFHLFNSIDDYQEFMVKYPSLKEKLTSYLDVDLARVVRKVADSRRFSLDGWYIDTFSRFDEVTHKKLEKILK